MTQRLLNPTYEEYAAALRKVGWTPAEEWVFAGKGIPHPFCVYMYIQAKLQAQGMEEYRSRQFEQRRQRGGVR